MDSGNQKQGKGAGSPTNASDAVDDIALPAHPGTEEKLDAGVKETFPASDPVSVPADVETVQPPPLPKRSADWVFDRHGAAPERAD